MTFELLGLAGLSGQGDPGVDVLFTARCLPLVRRGFLGTENVIVPKSHNVKKATLRFSGVCHFFLTLFFIPSGLILLYLVAQFS